MILAIDPGITGALAFKIGSEVSVEDMPSFKVQGTTRTKSEYDLDKLWALLSTTLNSDSLVYMEKVGPMPKNGSIACFSLGRGVGLLEGMLKSIGCTVKLVTPMKWKKHMQLSQDKNQSLDMARQWFPELESELKLKKYHNRAEALLLLAYAEETLFPKTSLALQD